MGGDGTKEKDDPRLLYFVILAFSAETHNKNKKPI